MHLFVFLVDSNYVWLCQYLFRKLIQSFTFIDIILPIWPKFSKNVKPVSEKKSLHAKQRSPQRNPLQITRLQHSICRFICQNFRQQADGLFSNIYNNKKYFILCIGQYWSSSNQETSANAKLCRKIKLFIQIIQSC